MYSEVLASLSRTWRQHQARAYQAALALRARRLFRISLATTAALFITLCLLGTSIRGSAVRKAPDIHAELKAHEKWVPNQEDSHEPLNPFPYSPMVPLSTDGHHDHEEDNALAPWLAAVMAPAQDIDRRMIIRSTWMRMYADLPFHGRFVISNPGSKWLEAVRYENRTYGDMIVLDHLPENAATANTIKTLEFYKWLVKQGRRYEFVSKIDTDLWFNARGFWDRYLQPRLNNSTGGSSSASPLKATVEHTAIGQLFFNDDLAFIQGSFYTHSWDLVELLASLQEENPVVMSEDRAVTALLQNAGKQAHLVNLNGTEKFDYDEADARTNDSPWARAATHPSAKLHALYGSDMVAVHMLKDRTLFMKIADCFDSKGVKSTPELEGTEKTPSIYTRVHDFLFSIGWSRHYESQLSRIPNSYYQQQGRDWIVDDVWNLGPGRTGYQS